MYTKGFFTKTTNQNDPLFLKTQTLNFTQNVNVYDIYIQSKYTKKS